MKLGVVTLLYNPSYLPGALVLGVALRKLVSLSALDVELAILIDELNFTRYQLDLLLELYDTLIPVQTLTSTLKDKLENDLGRPELAQTFTKVALWGLSRYDKVLYLDADTLPEYHARGEGTILDLFKLRFSQNKILAVPDSGFPDIFNSGLFVLQPNITDYERLIGLIVDSQLTGKSISFDGADQGLLNQYFNPQPNWVTDLLQVSEVLQKIFSEQDVANAEEVKSSKWIKLPFVYNVTPNTQYQYLPAYKYFTGEGEGAVGAIAPPLAASTESGGDKLISSTQATLDSYNLTASNFYQGGNQIKLTHFIGPYKPWFTESKHHIHAKWWDLWESYYGKTLLIDAIVFWESALGDHTGDTNRLYYLKGKEAGGRLGNDNANSASEERSEDSAETKEPQVYEEAAPVHQAPSVSDPESLCDPSSYQLLPSNIQPTVDSSWDATKEEPPHVTEVVREAPTKMEEEMKNFQNIWDGNGEEARREQPVEEKFEEKPAVAPAEPVPQYNPAPHSEIIPIPATGSREYLEPERVFYDEPVEFPSILQRTHDLQLEDQEEENELDEDEEEVIAEIEEEDLQEQIDFINVPVHSYKKIFPWEFNDKSVQPERSFDDEY